VEVSLILDTSEIQTNHNNIHTSLTLTSLLISENQRYSNNINLFYR